MELLRQEVKNPSGLKLDPRPSDLPLDSWSEGRNITFRDGKTLRPGGITPVFDPIVNPLFALPLIKDGTPRWIVGTDTSVFLSSGESWNSLGSGWNASPEQPWSGGVLGGVAVINNPLSTPRVLMPLSSDLALLPNWPDNTNTRILRPFKSYLIALGITRDSVKMPTVVKWSSPADPGEVPHSWDQTDPTQDAGENSLSDTAGAIVDGRKMRDAFIIYKEDAVYSMRHIGGVYVFQFQKLFDEIGVISQDCIAEFDGKHFVVDSTDIYVHNGVQRQSVINGHVRNHVLGALAGTDSNLIKVVPDYANEEILVCYPGSSSAVSGKYLDQAAVWNWRENHWTLRDLPNIFFGTTGVLDIQESGDWDVDHAGWNTSSKAWGGGSYDASKRGVVLLSRENDTLYRMGGGTTVDTIHYPPTVERTGLYGGEDNTIKHVTSVSPQIFGTGICNVYIGAAQKMDAPVEWFGPYPFDIGKDFKIDCRVMGRSLGFRFEFGEAENWELHGYTVETTRSVGRR